MRSELTDAHIALQELLAFSKGFKRGMAARACVLELYGQAGHINAARNFAMKIINDAEAALPKMSSKGEELGEVHGLLGYSYMWLSGKESTEKGLYYMEEAVKALPDLSESTIVLNIERAKQQLQIDTKVALWEAAEKEGNPARELVDLVPSFTEVERKSNLTYMEFFEKHAMGRRPVIITDYQNKIDWFRYGWEDVQRECGSMRIELTRRVKSSGTWGGLIPAGNSTVKDWIATIKEGGGEGRYAFDQSLPARCPKILSNFLIPKYFVADYMYRMPRGNAFFTNMPSLFLGESIESEPSY